MHGLSCLELDSMSADCFATELCHPSANPCVVANPSALGPMCLSSCFPRAPLPLCSTSPVWSRSNFLAADLVVQTRSPFIFMYHPLHSPGSLTSHGDEAFSNVLLAALTGTCNGPEDCTFTVASSLSVTIKFHAQLTWPKFLSMSTVGFLGEGAHPSCPWRLVEA